MQHFYDGQIRRYVTQMVRLMSNFSYKDNQDNLVTVPVMYGDITRQVGSILRDISIFNHGPFTTEPDPLNVSTLCATPLENVPTVDNQFPPNAS